MWICPEFKAAIAGKPAPTGSLVFTKPVFTLNPCGSWLASDGALSADRDLTWQPLSRTCRHSACATRSGSRRDASTPRQNRF
ncbi:hypothetical protein DJ564_30920 [Pseudomonas sp. 31-12]|nr:hypothetical protein DJ564_30920 [Pseudomonas sp. 31-12]